MIISRIHIAAIVFLTVITWGTALHFNGIDITLKHLIPFGLVVSILMIIWVLFEKFLWRVPLLHGWFVQRPDLQGTWFVELQSNWTNPETNQGIPPITCYMGITQSLGNLKMHLMTPESESWLVANSIKKLPYGSGYEIAGVYTNEPNIELRDTRKSEIHNGAIYLKTHGADAYPSSIKGTYWTDRRTTGQMDFQKRISEIFTRYEDAETSFIIEHQN